MSVPVDLEALRRQAAACGPAAFLVTIHDGPRPHVVSVDVGWDGPAIVVAAGGGTRANVERNPSVTLLWPADGQDYALIVDGDGRVDGDVVRIEPTGAVLHRSVLAAAPTGHREGDAPACMPVSG